MFHQDRAWEEYFREYGCVACGRTDVEHVANGLCASCRTRILARLEEIISRVMGAHR